MYLILAPTKSYINTQYDDLWRFLEKSDSALWKSCQIKDLLEDLPFEKYQALVLDNRALVDFGIYRDINLFTKLQTVLSRTTIPKVLVAAVDLHGIPLSAGDEPVGHSSAGNNERALSILDLSHHIDALLWNQEANAPSLLEIDQRYQDEWMRTCSDPKAAQQRIKDAFCIRCEYHFPMSEPQIHKHKKFIACVPGIRYSTRKVAQRSLAKASERSYPYVAIDKSLLGLSKFLGIKAETSGLVSQFRRANQAKAISSSHVSFVCGSALSYAVKKFFEIPSFGTAMIGIPFNGAQHCGFVEGETFVTADPEHFAQNARELFETGRARELANNAIDVLLPLHSFHARAEQLKQVLERLLESRLYGARFINGSFEFFGSEEGF